MVSLISHIIFDLDGLLIDTESIYTQCYEEFCAKFNKTFNWEVKAKQMGKKPDESAKVIIDHFNLSITVEEHHEMINKLLYARFPDCKVLPGVKRVLDLYKKRRIPMCIATGSDERSFRLKVSKNDWLMEYFSHVVCCGSDPEVTRGKPAPDGFLVAARRFERPPADMGRVLVFEDAENGVEGALAAGMKVVWCPDERANTERLSANANVSVLKSLEEFQPENYEMPMMRI